MDLQYKGAFILGRSMGIAGVVQTAQHLPSKTLVAVKRYNLERKKEQRSEEESSEAADFHELAKSIQHEVSSMRQLRHPNLLPCLSSFVSGFEIIVVSPLYKLRSVRDMLDDTFKEGLPELAIASILRDVLRALLHLHSQSIVHRSIRASHVLLNGSGHGVLSGLRYSTSLLEVGQGVQDRYDFPLYVARTNLNWLSPEILAQNLIGYNEKSDMYSLAVTACEMANGLVPFSEMPGTLMLLEKLRGASPKLLDQTTFDFAKPEDHSNEDEDGHIHDHPPQNHPEEGIMFMANQPGDSGVGASVESTSNGVRANASRNTLQELKKREAIYSSRKFSATFHNFVADSSVLDASQRPSAGQLLHHPFVKQLKKVGGHFSVVTLLTEASRGSSHPLLAFDENSDLELSEMVRSQLQLIVDEGERNVDIDWEF